MVQLPAEFLSLLEPIYGEQARGIQEALKRYATQKGLEPYLGSQAGWYRNLRLYTVYPDGVCLDPALPPLRNLAAHLPRVRRLNCNALHVLPFCDSPMVDSGFDISDPFRIRPGLGGLSGLLALRAAAEREGIHLFMDAVINHVSEKHLWFRRAQAGDARLRERFLHTQESPRFIRKLEREGVAVAEYRVGDGTVAVDIAFPELTGLVPHWRRGLDGFWYYHTYYPQELDLDWANPEVFAGVARMLLFWGSFGFNFRLDAIPFVGKPAYKLINGNNGRTHALILALKCLCEAIHPNSVLLAESFEALDAVKRYFGTPEREEVALAYNFHLCAATWAGLMERDAGPVWEALERCHPIPPHAQWLNFLRNHDELSLAHLPRKLALKAHEQLLRHGKDFGESQGVSGRTFSLLGRNPARFRMAYLLLASMPGSLMLIYGDEIAFGNLKHAALTPAKRKDTRNFGRGTLTAEAFQAPQAEGAYDFMAKLFGRRRDLGNLMEGCPERLEGPPDVFLARYRSAERELRIFINLSPIPRLIPQDLGGLECVLAVNGAKTNGQGLCLGRYAGLWLLGRPR